jgi:isoamylase
VPRRSYGQTLELSCSGPGPLSDWNLDMASNHRPSGANGPEPGTADPLGATRTADGVNFSVYSKHATGLDLLLFDVADDEKPSRAIRLDPRVNRSGEYWHVQVPGLDAGQLYAYAADGPWMPEQALRFDPSNVLLDPYGRGVAVPDSYRPAPAGDKARNVAAMKSVVIDPSAYDWEGDRPLHRPFRETIVYEAHLAGFTADPSSGVSAERRGTYLGFIEKIPYLVDLGVTAVELLPVFQFDRFAAPDGLINYWGYQPISFFAPHQQYAVSRSGHGPADEFRDLVKALHRAGLEVILDVVYNHTAELGADGPTFSYRGLADDDYYLHATDRSQYADYSGTGNTLNANGTIVRRMIVDSLRYWVETMHVDGFRFDLAAVLSRDETGARLADPPTLWDIETDPALAGTKVIAEAWDAGGLYEVGSFVGDRWVEWNGIFRDDVRAFVKGDRGKARAVALRFLGSPDVYGPRDREPEVSLNFVTCHDGFTLNDLVSYDVKHNEANGEGNRDGSDQNLSWDCGVEGPTTDAGVEALRLRQVKNFLAMEMLALGAPMLLMGDEVRRSQGGNNNAYCHDDPLAWFDWSGVERHAEILRFTRLLTQARRRLVAAYAEGDGVGLVDLLRNAEVEWHGVRLGAPDLSDESHSVALTAHADAGSIHLIFNAFWDELVFELPAPRAGLERWRRIVDTSLDPPDDIVADIDEARTCDGAYRAAARSVVVLVARSAQGPRDREAPR